MIGAKFSWVIMSSRFLTIFFENGEIIFRSLALVMVFFIFDSLKIFGPVAIVALLVLLPVNASGGTLFFLRRDLVVSNIDKLSISNIRPNSFK